MMRRKLLLWLRNRRKFRDLSPISLRYISYSIPLACIMTLIFGLVYGIIFINNNQSEEVYAADIPSSTASISIASPTLSNSSNPTNPNSMAYLSTNVTISAQYIQSYSLKISGNPNLTGASTISGTGTNVAVSNMGNNTWGYNWGATGTTDSNLTYSSLSTSGATLALDGLNSTGSANFTKKLTFAVKFGSAETGHYTNNITLSFTANPKTLIGYSVTYDVNGGIGGPANYSEQSYDTSKSYTIPSTPLPTRDGYGFLGWSTSSTATTADATYAPGKNITLTQASPTRKLYAVWSKTIKSITNMQEMTTTICMATPVGESATLIDVRDNKAYTIAKLADEKCWMTQNLALDLSITGIASSANSDNLSADYPATALINRWDTASTNAWVEDNTLEQFSKYPKQSVSYITEYGYYYSWCAATANTCAELISGTVANKDASGSICPKGWVLPSGKTGVGTNDFALMAGLATTNITINADYWGELSTVGKISFSSPVFTVNGSTWLASGYVDQYGVTNLGISCEYWSRTANSSTGARYMKLYSYTGNSFNPANKSDPPRFYGRSIRCIAK